MAKLFFSYCHVDEVLRNRLEVHLAMLKHQGLIEAWHDRRIFAGSELDKAIDKNLEEADIILLLVSSDFLASEYCFTREMARALERHRERTARVIPVILAPCDWRSSPLKNLLAVPTDGKPVTTWSNQAEALDDVTRQIRRAVEELHVSPGQRPAGVASGIESLRLGLPAKPANTVEARPRSSNLRLKKEFTDFDRDQFLHDAFDYMARFFESSLNELLERHPDVQGRFQRVDAHRFTVAVYRGGKSIAECSIRIDTLGSRSSNIAFSYSAAAPTGSSNEMLHVENDTQTMYFKPLGFRFLDKRHDQQLSQESASEYLWDLLMERLQ